MKQPQHSPTSSLFLPLADCLEREEERLPLGVRYMKKLYRKSKSNRDQVYRFSVLVLTFMAYTAYHMSRKPISIVKNSKQFLDCGLFRKTCQSWISEVDQSQEESAKLFLGLLDTTYLVSYAVFMFVSGFVAERVDLRIFLSSGMVLSGLFTALFGFAYYANIHTIWFLLVVQILGGICQTTGWPGVVTVMANWFGKGRRGLIMGIWNSHTSLGNILGSLIAGAFVTTNWGLSFIVPGLLMAACGVIIFLFLLPHPADVDLAAPTVPTPASSMMSTDTPTQEVGGLLLTGGGAGGQTPLFNRSLSSNKLCSSSGSGSSGGRDSPYFSDSTDSSLAGQTSPQEAITFYGALRIPGVVEFSFCLFFAKLVSYTFLYWLPNYINSTVYINAQESANLSTFFDIGGIVGGIVAGLISDRSGMSASTCAAMLVSAIPTLFYYQNMVTTVCPMAQVNGRPVYDICYASNVFMLMLTGILVNGPYALITTAVSAELGTHKSLKGSSKALATVTAIIDGTGSIGAAVGPFLAGWLTGNGAWENVFNMLMLSNVLALIFLARLVKNDVRRWRRRRFS